MRNRRPAMLPRNFLGRTGLEVSLLGFGAEPLGRKGRSFEDAAKTLNDVLDVGVTLIDTAAAYGNSEEFIGRALADRHRRGEFTLVTKCGWTNPDYRAAWSPAGIAATIDESLRRLRIECVDVLLLHSCDLDMLKHGAVIDAATRSRDQGKAKHIGYSGDNQALGFAVDSECFDVIECSFSILDQANAPAIEAAAQANIGVMLKRPIANAVPGAVQKPRSEYAAQYWPRWQEIGLIQSDATEFGASGWVEAAMRFSGFWPGVACVLVGSSNADHMRDNVRWLEEGPLPVSAIRKLREAFEKAGHDWPALG